MSSNLKNNTASLQVILDTVNSLPEAGNGGASLETCTVTVYGEQSATYPTGIVYTTVDANGSITYKYDTCSTSSITITCLKNSVVTVIHKSEVGLSQGWSSPYMLFKGSSISCIAVDGSRTGFNYSNNSAGAGSDD